MIGQIIYFYDSYRVLYYKKHPLSTWDRGLFSICGTTSEAQSPHGAYLSEFSEEKLAAVTGCPSTPTGFPVGVDAQRGISQVPLSPFHRPGVLCAVDVPLLVLILASAIWTF
jgi:hypothetical protein